MFGFTNIQVFFLIEPKDWVSQRTNNGCSWWRDDGIITRQNDILAMSQDGELPLHSM